MDRLHVSLLLACLVLLASLLGVYGSLSRQATEDWVAEMTKVQKDLGDSLPLSKQVAALEEDPDAAPDHLADVRARQADAEKVFQRDNLRGYDREQVLKMLADLYWYVWGAVIFALVMIGLGWAYWSMTRRPAQAPSRTEA